MKNSCNACGSGSPESACSESSILSQGEIGTEKPSDSQEEDKVIQGILINLSEEISRSSHSPEVWAVIIERASEMLKEEKADIGTDVHLLNTQSALTDMIEEYHTKYTVGRPTIFKVDIAMKILNLIEEGKSLYEICKDPEMPSKGSVIRWVYQHDTFGTAYRQARQQQAHILADGALEAAEEASDTDKLKIQKARLVSAVRFQAAEKYNPGEFGGKVSIQGVIGHLSHEETVRMLEEREAKAAAGSAITLNPIAQIVTGTVTVPHSE